jgi:hypothetical protein
MPHYPKGRQRHISKNKKDPVKIFRAKCKARVPFTFVVIDTAPQIDY